LGEIHGDDIRADELVLEKSPFVVGLYRGGFDVGM
jgi:hypothetical protein